MASLAKYSSLTGFKCCTMPSGPVGPVSSPTQLSKMSTISIATSTRKSIALGRKAFTSTSKFSGDGLYFRSGTVQFATLVLSM